PVGDFWEAEPEHQDYLEKRPGGYTCHFERKDWVLPKRQNDGDAQAAVAARAE
ncbi:MAG: peptide-methionine (S)-S-oxide reductase, partial [Novosphingobium sp.]